jgi:hypothetical protein
LAASPNPFRVEALVELAKQHEHRTKNLALALEMTRAALELEDTAALRRREDRLVLRTSRSTAKSARFL